MKGTKIRNRIFALILALVMVISIVTVSASAATAENNDTTTEQKYTTKLDDPVEIYESVTIESDGTGEITEVVSLRQENAKHFKMPDGTYQVVYYANPVHRKDASGSWQDIDNSLTLKTDSALFLTSDNRMSFAKSFQPNESLFTLNENSYSVSMTLIENTLSSGALATMSATNTVTLTPQATVTNAPQRQTRWETIDDAVAINNSGSIKYNSIRQSTDLEYVLVGNDIKENIIINAPLESYVYNFRIDVSGLYATLEASGEVLLKDIETDRIKYRIPAPYMFDANGVMSCAVYYDLVSLSKGSYTLTVTADSEWINDSARNFPVTIDPTIRPESDSYDTYVSSASPDDNFGLETSMKVGSGTQAYIYIDLYNLPAGAEFTQAILASYSYIEEGSSGQTMTVNAHQILSDWDETEVKWSNKPTLGTTVLSSSTLAYSDSITENAPTLTWFQVDEVVEGWLNGTSENFGIALVASSSNGLVADFKTYESGLTDMPFVVIGYSYILEGVFGIENALWENHYITAESPNVNYYTAMGTSYISNKNFVDEFRQRSLFKIINVNGTEQYILRSMYDNTLILSVEGGNLKLKRVYLENDDIPNSDTFIIQWDGRGYQIRPYGTANILYLSGTDQLITTKPQSEVTSAARWNFTEYTEPELTFIPMTLPTTAMHGSSITLSPQVWSTDLEKNLPYMYISGDSEHIATGTWDSNNVSFKIDFINPGSITVVLAISNGTGGYITLASHSIRILLESGEYYFVNQQRERMLQLNTDVDFYLTGSILREGTFNAAQYQKFTVYHRGNGLYSIISTASNLAITTDNTITGTSITQEHYAGLPNQLWSFYTLQDGDLIIKSKVGSMSVLMLNTVASRTGFDYESSYKYTHWRLMSTAPVDATLVGVPDYEHSEGEHHVEHNENFEDIIDDLRNIGYKNVRSFEEITVTECLIYMCTSRIFFFRGHGIYDCIQVNDYADDMVSLSDIYFLASNAFSNCELIVLSSCLTGSGYEDADNFVNALVEKGATTVVGFTREMYCYELTEWELAFFEYIGGRSPIVNAAIEACEDSHIDIEDLYVAGSKFQVVQRGDNP